MTSGPAGPGTVPFDNLGEYSSSYYSLMSTNPIVGQVPVATGVSEAISFSAQFSGDGPATIDGVTIPGTVSGYVGFESVGYLLPPATDKYTLQIDHVDDIMFFWYGDIALSGWNTRNGLFAYYTPTYNFLTFNAVAGVPLPFRLLYINAETASGFNIKLTRLGDTITNLIGTSALVGSCSGAINLPVLPF
jgi:hypothetical protein